jgi:hypothetical protein
MAEEKEEWNKVEVPEKEKEEKVQYEVEGEETEEVQASKEPEPKVKEKEPEVKEDVPEELEGIETKGAQKRIKQLIRQRRERDEQIQKLIQQNEQLQYTTTQQRTDFTKVSKLNLDATEKQLNDKVNLARGSYLEAFESQNKEKLLQAQEALNDAQTDLKSLHYTRQQFPEENTGQPPIPAVPQQIHQPAPDPRAEDWASKNEWFGKDNIMTASALAIDAELKNEGYTPEDPDFYTEVSNRLKTAFPQKFTEGTVVEEKIRKDGSSTPSQVVAGGSRSSPNSKKVKLSQSDIRLANKWNIPLEQYAAEKLKTDKAEGEYTTVNMKRGG